MSKAEMREGVMVCVERRRCLDTEKETKSCAVDLISPIKNHWVELKDVLGEFDQILHI